MYSIAVTATQATIDKRPEMVQKMVTALLRGFRFTVANPAEAVKVTSKLHPELDADYVKASVDTLLEGHVGRDLEGQGHRHPGRGQGCRRRATRW